MSARRVMVISAGLGQPSSTRLLGDRLATATADALLEQGLRAEVQAVELRDHAHALANNLVAGFASGELRGVLDDLARADAVIAVTPIFQASYSGLFKTFFDVLDADTLKGTPVLLAATGGTARHSLALEHALRPMFAYLKAITVPTAVFAASEDWGAGGADGQGLADRVARAGAELADLAAGRENRGRADEFADPVPFEQLLSGH